MQDTLLCAALRGENPAWPETADQAFTARFLERSAYHGVQPLLHSLLTPELADSLGWPREIMAACHREAIARTMWELRHQALLKQVLAHLADTGVQPVLFKGTALAYGLYHNPILRSRGDSDLIVPLQDRVRAIRVLESQGFIRGESVSGDYVHYQSSFTHYEASGTSHCLDLHWRINNSQLLAQLFTYEELRARARNLPELGPHALAAGAVDALLLACMHRSVHKQSAYYVEGIAHFSGDRLIWLHDIHLLAQQLTADAWTEFTDLATRKGLRAVCLEGLELARRHCGTQLADALIGALARPGPREPVAQYLESSRIRRLWLDFCAIGKWRGKLGFARESLFPPVRYMRRKYPDTGAAWLPWLYLRRIASGVIDRMKSRGE